MALFPSSVTLGHFVMTRLEGHRRFCVPSVYLRMTEPTYKLREFSFGQRTLLKYSSVMMILYHCQKPVEPHYLLLKERDRFKDILGGP
jgi:hypothetical protein